MRLSTFEDGLEALLQYETLGLDQVLPGWIYLFVSLLHSGATAFVELHRLTRITTLRSRSHKGRSEGIGR